MSERPDNIDDIFRNSIDNMETQPSEGFWIKASEDALFKSNLSKKKALAAWKTVAAVLVIALLSLSAYVVYLQGHVDSLNERVSTVENKKSTEIVAQNNGTTISQQEHANKAVVEEKPQAENKLEVQNATSGYKKHSRTTKDKIIRLGIMEGKPETKEELKKSMQSLNITYSQTTSGNAVIAYSKSKNKLSPNRLNSQTGTTSATSVNGINALAENNNITLPQINAFTEPLMEYNIPVVSNKLTEGNKIISSKLSVAIFYEPYISDELLENDMADNIIVNNSVVASEEELHPYTIGARAEYNLSSRLSFITGCNFYNFKVSFQPTTIFAQKMQNGDVGYTFQTSAGSVNCPYGNTNPNVGDAMIVNGSYTTDYISVPVYAKYSFLKKNNWSIYATGGVEINLVVYRKVNMQWQQVNWKNSGDATEGISNSSNVFYSFYFAPGISYSLGKGISIYAEPSLQGSPVLMGTDGIIKKSSPFVGMGTGLTVQL